VLNTNYSTANAVAIFASAPKLQTAGTREHIFAYKSDSCPGWYAESLEKDEEEFWDNAYGEGFTAWYLETVLESAKDAKPPPAIPLETLLLPGISIVGDYWLDYP
jgi:hypothetical protein